MVGLNGFEPLASSLSGTRSNQLSYKPTLVQASGGGARIRTEDLLLAKQALSQLSYTPMSFMDLLTLGNQLGERSTTGYKNKKWVAIPKTMC